jgi:hypothetical protein
MASTCRLMMRMPGLSALRKDEPSATDVTTAPTPVSYRGV